LWEESRAKRPDLNPSHLVQEALEGWTRSRATPAFSQDRPDDAEAAFALARGRLAGQAREEFERGYRAALVAAETLDLWVIESLVKQHFDVVPWAKGFASSAVEANIGNIPKEWGPDPEIIGALLKALGNLISPWGDDAFSPSAPYLRGFAQAMRDLWEESFEGTASRSGSDSGSHTRSRSGSASGSRTKSASRSGADNGYGGGEALGAGHSDGSGWGDGDDLGAGYGDGTGDG